jgi:DNA repair exonuclease SbcCD nuclease subunit
VSENLSLRYARQEAPGIHVGALHCNVGSVADHAPYSPCTLNDLGRAGMHYWALGHIHKRQILRTGSPWVVYAGTTQARSHKPSEAEPKGAMLITAEGDRIDAVDFVSLDSVRFVRTELDIAACADLVELHRLLRDQATAVRDEHIGRGVLLRVTLTGRGPVHRDLLPGKIAELTQELREELDGVQPFLWWESIRRETLPDLDRDAIRGRDDFSAELLAFSDSLRMTPESLLGLSERLRSLPAAAAQHLPELDQEQLAEVLRAAEDQALDLLEGNAS